MRRNWCWVLLVVFSVGIVWGVGRESGNLVAGEEEEPDPEEVREAAIEAGLASLAGVPIPEPDNLGDFLKPGNGGREAAIRLGKAFFWDMQVGSDGQACASCHFHAGADVRTKNQLSPGLKNVNEALRSIFDPTASGGGGPNYELEEDDFPFHRLEDPEEENFDERIVEFDSDDVTSSQGVFNANFKGTIPGEPTDLGDPFPDDVFNVNGVNVRRVEPRNTPTMINAVFNFANFWDGRAHNEFNGVSVIGPLDPDASILVKHQGSLVPWQVSLNNSSLASQAVGPPGSDLEMSFFHRPFPEVGRKLLGVRPLALQVVHPNDSVLGKLSRAHFRHGQVVSIPGLNATYGTMIREAFRPRFWNSNELTPDGYTQMEANFSLFFGLAVQMYESTLVSDRAPFDCFMEGDDEALDDEELIGLLTFIREPTSKHPVFTEDIGIGNCISCHGGPEFTDAAFTSLAEGGDELELLEVEEMPELLAGELFVGEQTAYLDNGFSNIGVRPADEDPGRGGEENGFPLSFARQALLGLPFAPEIPDCEGDGDGEKEECPEDDRVAVDGAFKVPGLRNVALTGPYFHNGGQATLAQVVEFYDRRSDFGDVNIAHLDRNMARISLIEGGEEALIEFLLALTDPRVQDEIAPFDHPQLFVANGHPGDHSLLECVLGIQACDDVIVIPPVGAAGRPAEGLDPLGTFLDLDHLEEDDDD